MTLNFIYFILCYLRKRHAIKYSITSLCHIPDLPIPKHASNNSPSIILTKTQFCSSNEHMLQRINNLTYFIVSFNDRRLYLRLLLWRFWFLLFTGTLCFLFGTRFRFLFVIVLVLLGWDRGWWRSGSWKEARLERLFFFWGWCWRCWCCGFWCCCNCCGVVSRCCLVSESAFSYWSYVSEREVQLYIELE